MRVRRFALGVACLIKNPRAQGAGNALQLINRYFAGGGVHIHHTVTNMLGCWQILGGDIYFMPTEALVDVRQHPRNIPVDM